MPERPGNVDFGSPFGERRVADSGTDTGANAELEPVNGDVIADTGIPAVTVADRHAVAHAAPNAQANASPDGHPGCGEPDTPSRRADESRDRPDL